MFSHIIQRIRKYAGLSNKPKNQLSKQLNPLNLEANSAHTAIHALHHPDQTATACLSTDCSSVENTNLDSRNAMWRSLRAALRGDKDAQYQMGLSYLNGQLGLDRSYSHAEKWLDQAAGQGHPTAKHTLESAYDRLAFS